MPLRGFFSTSVLLSKKPLPTAPQCGKCQLLHHCQSPKIPISGKGRRRVLLVGEAPAATEDRENSQFVGEAGRLLESTLAEIGVDMRQDCWLTNSVICMPKGKNGRWRNPTSKEIQYCRPSVVTAVRQLQPDVIVLLGGKAVQSVVGWVWREETLGGMRRWEGWRIPCRQPNAWLCPVWHPSFILHKEGEAGSKGKNEVMRYKWTQWLKRAFELKGKPWATPPAPYEGRVQPIMDPDAAVPLISKFIDSKRPIAFDYETDGLKPDSKDLDIISCGMSDGQLSFAYPWHGKAIDATRRVLRSTTPKVGYNMEYEQRWSMAKLGTRVRNWKIDGMQAAHVLDNRPGKICGLEFQEFVWLGLAEHKSWIKPYMKSKGTNTKNRLREVDLRKLLQYNAMDALVEWEVTQAQASWLGIPLED